MEWIERAAAHLQGLFRQLSDHRRRQLHAQPGREAFARPIRESVETKDRRDSSFVLWQHLLSWHDESRLLAICIRSLRSMKGQVREEVEDLLEMRFKVTARTGAVILTHVDAGLASRADTVAARFPVTARETCERNTRSLDGSCSSDGLHLGEMADMGWWHVVMDMVMGHV